MTTRSLTLIAVVLLTFESAARSGQDAEKVYVLTRPELSIERVEQVIGHILAATWLPLAGEVSKWLSLQGYGVRPVQK